MMDKNLLSYEQSFTSWTDDSGVGSSCNQVHTKDGRRPALHEYEDRSFRFRRDEYNLCLYGVFFYESVTCRDDLRIYLTIILYYFNVETNPINTYNM